MFLLTLILWKLNRNNFICADNELKDNQQFVGMNCLFYSFPDNFRMSYKCANKKFEFAWYHLTRLRCSSGPERWAQLEKSSAGSQIVGIIQNRRANYHETNVFGKNLSPLHTLAFSKINLLLTEIDSKIYGRIKSAVSISQLRFLMKIRTLHFFWIWLWEKKYKIRELTNSVFLNSLIIYILGNLFSSG